MSDAPTKKRGAQWANSYEAQLSDSDLLWLHTALLSRTPSDKAIRAKMPPWKSGPRTGQPVSFGTLSNIRARLEAEESYRDAEQAAVALVKERQEREPGISEAELEEYGQRVFTEITIHRQDLKGFVKLRSARNKAKLDQAKLALSQQAEARQREALALEQDRFRRDTCALFLKWAEDQRAKDIAQGSGTNAEKIDALGQLMFGGDWKTA